MINLISGLHKEIHHVKTMNDGQETYEPTLVITRERIKGHSFMIPLNSMWKYIDPGANRDEITVKIDRDEFHKLVERALFRGKVAVSYPDKCRAAADLACCGIAQASAKVCGIMLVVAWNLAKCMQMMEIEPTPQAMAQLLLWIQNALDDLKNYREFNPADEVVDKAAGEVSLFEGGKRIATKEVQVTATDLAEEAQI